MKTKILILLLCLCLSTAHADELQDISDGITANCSTVERKIVAIKQFVYKTIKPDYERGHPTERLTSLERIKRGVGWCDQGVKVFIDLCAKQGIKARMLFLMNHSTVISTSPHTIGEAWDGRWVMVDPSSPLEIYYMGRLASYEEIKNDEYIKLYGLEVVR